jgi:predicted deacylase
MHGDETANRELLLRLIYHLASSYQRDGRTSALLDSTDIHILPSMNPDGYELRWRWNANQRDLNRNWPLNNSTYGERQHRADAAVAAGRGAQELQRARRNTRAVGPGRRAAARVRRAAGHSLAARRCCVGPTLQRAAGPPSRPAYVLAGL